MIMNLMRASGGDISTAFVFNCQTGKRRTTTAMVIGKLICQQHTLNLAEVMADVASTEDEHLNKVEAGNFAVIREVQKRLSNGQGAKHWVDSAVDECATVCNIRTVINEYLICQTPKPNLQRGPIICTMR